MRTSTVAFLSVSATLAAACAGPDHFELVRRQAKEERSRPHSDKRQSASANHLGPGGECSLYGIGSVTGLITDGELPPIWETANLATATAADMALFTTLNATVPNFEPRGTRTGNFTGVVYDGVADSACWWSYKQCTTPKTPGVQPDIVRVPQPNAWGFTLDDGPNCSHNAFFDYLQEQKQKASLFYIGSNVVNWPYEAQRGLDDGHEICAHTWSHPAMTSLTNEEVFAELYYSVKAIKAVLGVTVQCWRPPYGDVDDRVRYIAQALGLSTVIWVDNTFDYTIATTTKSVIDANYEKIFAKQAAGDYSAAGTIVLTHELNNFTMSEVEEYLPQIQKTFDAVIPIAVAMNNTEPYKESGYTYPNYAQYIAGTTSVNLATATIAGSAPTLSLPFTAGQSGSISDALPYQTNSAAVLEAPMQTTIAGSSVAAVATPTTGGAQSASATSRASSSSRTSGAGSAAAAGSTTGSSSGASKNLIVGSTSIFAAGLIAFLL